MAHHPSTLPAPSLAPSRRWLADWGPPLGLLALAVIPTLAGAVRLLGLATGETTMPEHARFAADPLPAVVHIVSATAFCVLGAFQLSGGLRREAPTWHRAAGRGLAPAGIVAALSGMWMAVVYPPAEHDGAALLGLRLAAGAAMAGFLAMGLVAIPRRDFVAHGDWMTRGYALGIAAGTQAFTHLPFLFVEGLQNEAGRVLAMASGWALNVAVAEWVIRRRAARRDEARARRAPGETMKAVVYDRYGGPEVLRVEELPRPSPGPGQVLLRVVCASVNAADYRLLRADPFIARFDQGLSRPKRRVLGADVAGVVEAIGPEVATFQVGDAVFGATDLDGLGAFAERVCLRESALAHVPHGVSLEEAAATPLAGVTALQAIDARARVTRGDAVLVHGAGGGVGTFLVQLAKARGAIVTAVAGPDSAALLRALGADRVLDYTTGEHLRDELRYDAVFGVNGHRTLGEYRDRLKPGGVYVMVGGTSRQMFAALLFGKLRFALGSRRIELLVLDDDRRADDLRQLRALLATGALRPAIDRVFPLLAVADALRYVERGHVRGKVVLDARLPGAQPASGAPKKTSGISVPAGTQRSVRRGGETSPSAEASIATQPPPGPRMV